MSSRPSANLRLVRCPKCDGLLPELEDLPLYRCGGCHTVLQAKNRKIKVEDTKSVLSKTALASTDDLGHISDDKESSSSSQNVSPTPAPCNSGDQNSKFPRNGPADCVVKTEDLNIPTKKHIDDEVLVVNKDEDASDFKGAGNDELSAARGRRSLLTAHNLNESLSPGKQPPYGPDRINFSVSSFSSSSSDDLPFNWKENSTAEADLPTDDTKYPDALQCQSMEEARSQKEETLENAPNFEASMDEELLVTRKRRPIIAVEGIHHPKASSPVKGVYDGLDDPKEGASGREEIQFTEERGSSSKNERASDEVSSSDVVQCPASEEAEHPRKSFQSGNEPSRPAHELETTEGIDPTYELNGAIRKMTKSATIRSGYDYDGSIGSFDDQEDHIYKHRFRDANYFKNDERSNFYVDKTSGITAMQQQAREFFASDRKYRPMQEDLWSPVEPLESMRPQVRNPTDLAAEKYSSGVPYMWAYEKGGPSSGWCGDLPSDSGVYSANRIPYREKERTELLQMVYELKDELNRNPKNNGNVNRRDFPQFYNGRPMPGYQQHGEYSDEARLQSNFSKYQFSRSEQGTNWPRQHQNSSWMPFSGEVSNYRRHDDYSYYQRQPMDRPFSAQLSPTTCSLSAGLNRVHLYPSDQFSNPYSSLASSPQRQMDSEFTSRVRDATYGDQRYMQRYAEPSLIDYSIDAGQVQNDYELKKFHGREKQVSARPHIRPVAGGAPFVTCYHCWSPLQLPADSFVFKRRFHKLKCGTCSTILKFSVIDKNHIVPYVHNYRAHDLLNEVKGRSPIHYGAPHMNFSSHENQTSCSDHEFGTSFCRSCSTERDQVFLAAPAHHAVQANTTDARKASSVSTSENLEARKRRFSKRPVEAQKTAGPSTNRKIDIDKYSSESRESRSKAGSPLHRLMGYPTISQVFRGPSKGTSESFRNKSAR